MSKFHSRYLPSTILSSLLGLTTLLCIPVNVHSYGQSSQFSTSPKLTNKSSADDDLGRPPKRSSGASRNSNITVEACPGYVIALVPGEGTVEILDGDECLQPSTPNRSNRATLAHTSESMTNVWVYIPQAYVDLGVTAEVVLIDNRRKIDSWQVALPPEEGLICIPLPYELEAENVYQWLFEVRVNEQNPAENPKVGGLIQYTQQAETYWYDELTQLGQQIQDQPAETNPAIIQWQVLLESQGLGAIASSPILNSCAGTDLDATVHNQLPTNTNGAQ